ncbi:NAD(P)-binding domain-containing protein [Pyramidobacter sp. YE332]|uniref:NAD(P)-binding domain-containing protein n=1 Tax=Pyramidobacter sp. YE332 TaxID=3068894 RepID=UPI0031BAC67D
MLAAKIGAKARELGGEALDAPVSGGDVGAREAKLTIMAGGRKRRSSWRSRCSPPWAKNGGFRAHGARGSIPRWPTRSPSRPT